MCYNRLSDDKPYSQNWICTKEVEKLHERYLVDFSWSRGTWRYKRILECPGTLKVKDIQGQYVTLWHVETNDAQETLEIHMAPDGNRRQQIHHMMTAAKNG